jgi:transposase
LSHQKGVGPRTFWKARSPGIVADVATCAFLYSCSVGQVAKDFDLTETAVRQWVTQAERDAGTRTDGLTSDERDELARLRRENRRLSEHVEILKRATASFAKEIR